MNADSTQCGTDSQPTGNRGAVICPQCEGNHLVHRQCKSLCEACGYVESCEDNFIPNQKNPTRPTAT